MQLGLEDRAVMDEPFIRHFDTCLGCMACVTACPSGVQYDHLIEATRPQIERHATRGAGDRWFRRLIFALFPYPKRLWFVALACGGIRSSVSSTCCGPQPVGTAPLPGSRPWRASLRPSPGARSLARCLAWCRLRASGDVESVCSWGACNVPFFPSVNDATVRVLAAEGCEVVVPAQGCCGALMMHAGLEEDAIAMAKRLIDTFEDTDVDTIVINAAGCGSTLKTYGHLLRDEPDYAERAAALAAKCKDISEVLAELPPRAPRHPLSLTVAYHDACHLQHAQGVTSEPRKVLAGIPGVEVRDIPEAGLCCGSAGIYNLVEPEAARELGERKAKNVLSTGADAVVSSNPGCLLQLQKAMNDDASEPMPAALSMYHLVEV